MKTTTAQRERMARFIVNAEARHDKNGRLAVYKLPSADGGGTFEVAGINDRYHPLEANTLRDLIQQGHCDDAEELAVMHIAEYTDVVTKWTTHPAIEAYLRDCAFNRGPKGALRILQLAVKVADDGKYGPMTKAAITQAIENPAALLKALRAARERYERRIAPPVGARAKFWNGLQNRWNSALAFARGFLV